MSEPDDPTVKVMRALGWTYEGSSDGFRRDGLWVARNQAQAGIAAAINGKPWFPAHGQSPEFAEIIVQADGPAN